MSGRHPSKNLELSPSDSTHLKYTFKHRLIWNDNFAVLKIFWYLIGDI
jgi:hypothetical protein